MDKDKIEICNIISEMLDNQGEHGIYPTTVCYEKLERYIEGVRIEAIGWTHADACCSLANGFDPRKTLVPELLERALIDLASRIDPPKPRLK